MKIMTPPPDNSIAASAPASNLAMLPADVLEEEERFYQEYTWCLNPCLTVQSALERLQGELARLHLPLPDWQRQEVMTNIFLLACGLLNSVDDYLRGPVYELPRLAKMIPFARLVLNTFETWAGWRRSRRVRRVAAWRERMLASLATFLRHYVAEITSAPAPPPDAGAALEQAARSPLPADLLSDWTHLPSAFRKLDLAPHDILELGRRFVTRFPDRSQPILAAGLRTAGSYFAPLLSAFLAGEGYQTVATVTFRPDRGLGRHEKKLLEEFARARYLAAILDDPPVSGETFAHAADILGRLGFASGRVVALFPLQAAPVSEHQPAALTPLATLSIEPDQWHKTRVLDSAAVETRLVEYFHKRGYAQAQVIRASRQAAEFNCRLRDLAEDPRRTRLKRVYEVRLENPAGDLETRFVLAKSVGWGYLSYHAFLIAQRLPGLVPPLLGLRDGLLFTEWLPQQPLESVGAAVPVEINIDAIACYTAARVVNLRLPAPAAVRAASAKHHHGLDLLESVLCQAYGSKTLARLMRSRMRRRASFTCPLPTLVDGRMRPAEWLQGPAGLLKSDYEHHGMGKNELNVVDPAFDLAQAMLHGSFSPEEEDRLLSRYAALSGDYAVAERIFINKLLAGIWSLKEAIRNLEQSHLAQRHEDFHKDYVRAWDFLTAQTARHCGRLCRSSEAPAWRAPLVVLDVDGVLDRRIFGFPCTSAAGIEALTLLHVHHLSIALNSARSAPEMRAYCQAYGCAGAVAEYGSYLWDAVQNRGRVLVSAAALRQLERARAALGRLPGVFVNAGYEYSIRACTYEEGGPVPLPTPTMQRLMLDEKLDTLAWHQTTIDSTIVAADVNKGTGLAALLDFIGLAGASTYAVGDSEPDLAMFRGASRSFAPAHIKCARLAGFAGCKVAPHPFQRGLLHIVRELVHPEGGRCGACSAQALQGKKGADLFLDMLRVVDEKRLRLLLRAVFHPAVLGLFVR